MNAKTQPFIPLRFEDKDLHVQVETEQEDRFFLTVQAAILACQAFGKFEEFTRQFRHLQAKLSEWIRDHDSQIAKAFLTVRESAILLLVVQKSEAFDQELEESLTDLDIAIAQEEEFNLIRLNVLALPNASDESIQSFFVAGRVGL